MGVTLFGMRLNRAEYARFMRNVRTGDGCWVWTGPQTPNGYGKHRVGPGAPERVAHRIAYEHFTGEIPVGLQLDHLCRNRLCVNPAHVEAVTAAVNTTRQDHANRRKTCCPAGHEYTPENTLIGSDGKRRCRTCRRARNGSHSSSSSR